MKKFRYTLLLLSLVFVLVACAKSPKEEFKSRLESLQSEKKAAFDYKNQSEGFEAWAERSRLRRT